LTKHPFIRCDRITKSYGDNTVIEDLSLEIADGEFVSLLGPSGSGKTTLLMMMAGFEDPSAGSIWLDGIRVDRLPPHKRNMGVVFQSYALFPHMTVGENVAFPLKMRHVPRGEIRERVQRALEMVELTTLSHRRPVQLSGGQQQRVALARALVFEPRVVLMDEPLGALDKRLRQQMQLDIRDLHNRLGLTIVFVTHDQSEALTMSDRIAVFNKGRIEQVGAPHEIYDCPGTRFVAEFIGETNMLEGEAETDDGGTLIRLANGSPLRLRQQRAPGSKVEVSIRPERIMLDPNLDEENVFEARVTDCVYFGDHTRFKLDVGGSRLLATSQTRGRTWQPGSSVKVGFKSDDCWILPR